LMNAICRQVHLYNDVLTSSRSKTCQKSATKGQARNAQPDALT